MGTSRILGDDKTRTPDIPVDLVQRSVKTEVPAKQELHRLTEAQQTRLMVKQDEIPRIEKPGTNRGYYLFVEDDSRCMTEQQDKEGSIQLIRDMDTDQILPMNQITETEAEMYQIPKTDQPTMKDDVETISSISTADYDREEVEASLTNIADTFHVIGQEYKKLVRVVPHMSKTQAASVIARMLILPLVKQEAKAESKQDPTEPLLGTTQEQIAIQEGPRVTQDPTEVMEEETIEKEEDKPEVEVTDKYFRKYILTGKGKDPKAKINKACKEINYQNLVVLTAVRDYVINKAKNIKEIAKKWGLSFISIQ